MLSRIDNLTLSEIKILLKKHGYLVNKNATLNYIIGQINGEIPLVKISPNLKKYKMINVEEFSITELITLIKSNTKL